MWVCPRCGYLYRTRFGDLQRAARAQAWKIFGLIVAIAGALYGQAEMIGEPWRHYISIVAIVGTAVLALYTQKPGTSSVPPPSLSPSPVSPSPLSPPALKE